MESQAAFPNGRKGHAMLGLRSATVLTLGTLGIAAAVAVAAPATADPKGELVTITCDNGHTYSAVVAGNGEFTPAHDTASTAMLIPTSFGRTDFVVVQDSTGTVVDSGFEPPVFKGSARPPVGTSTSCTFTAAFHDVAPDVGAVTVTVRGTVSGFVTPVG
jgi:hypothetical protein